VHGGAGAVVGLGGVRRLDRKWMVLVAIGVGTFMSALDGSVVNTILPVVARDFGSTVAAIEWVVTIYLLVVSGLLLSVGRLGDLRGHKAVYLGGFAIFVAASACCGVAASPVVLVAARGVQAIGGAMLYANSPAILTTSFPAHERGRALGLQATMTYLGLTAGPSVGGWLAGLLGWRAVFYINVPVGLVALALGWRFIPHDAGRDRAERFDRAGALIFLAGLVALLLALNRGADLGWASPIIVGSLLAAVALLAAFVAIERRVPAPMLDLALFRSRTFSASVLSAVLNYVCVYTVLFMLPFHLIQARGLTPAQAGAILTTQPIVMAIVAPLSGTLSDRIGARALGVGGMGGLTFGLWLLSRLTLQSPTSSIVLGLGVVGLGTGMFISPNSSALMGAAPRHRQGIASGVLALARNVGMVLGVGLAGAVYTTAHVRGMALGAAPAVVSAVAATFAVAAVIAAVGMITAAVPRR
jgi:EmrB/QacA subfamily drug resistance transporter